MIFSSQTDTPEEMKDRYSRSVLGQSPWVYYVMLDPGHWGTGTARRLVEYALSIHHSLYNSSTHVLGVVSTNYSALPLYHRLGFELWGGQRAGEKHSRYSEEREEELQRGLRALVNALGDLSTSGDSSRMRGISDYEKFSSDGYDLLLVRHHGLAQVSNVQDTHDFHMDDEAEVTYREINTDGEKEAVEVLIRQGAMRKGVARVAWEEGYRGWVHSCAEERERLPERSSSERQSATGTVMAWPNSSAPQSSRLAIATGEQGWSPASSRHT